MKNEEKKEAKAEKPGAEAKNANRIRRDGAGLDADIRAAKELGLSYGQYMAKYKWTRAW